MKMMVSVGIFFFLSYISFVKMCGLRIREHKNILKVIKSWFIGRCEEAKKERLTVEKAWKIPWCTSL